MRFSTGSRQVLHEVLDQVLEGFSIRVLDGVLD
jgi:hypothetical protein